jgi:antitoxin ParD1/3/4
MVPEVLMAKVEKISIALPPEMVGAIRDAVVSGEYASTSEVIRDALRDWTLKRKMAIVELDEMQRLVREGIESGPGVDADLVFARLRAKYAGSTEE